MSRMDLVVVGAGPFGLIAAHTWLELNPESDVVILESDTDLGGAWSKTRVYPTMMTQTPVGMLEYSSYPLEPPLETFHDYFSAEHVCDYLDAFSQSKKFSGKTVKERIRFSSNATQISKEEGSWKIEVMNGTLYTCKKLIMATGLTSTPDIPPFLCYGKCKALVIHSKYLAKESQFLQSPQAKNVVVLGGSKSAFDAVYMLSQAGKSVSWIIRTKGQGPANMVPPDVPLLRNSHEPQSMKIIGKISPSIFEPVDGWVRFFHQSTIGSWINGGIWNTLDWMWQRAGGYSRNKNLEKLRPDRPAFWASDGIGVSNSSDLWDTLSKAKIYRDEIDRLEEGKVILSSGEMVECDVIVACTGWSACYPMFSTDQAQAMGLSLSLLDTCESDTAKWEALITQADEKVLQRFPRLLETPSYPDRKPTISSHYLYRGIIPTTSTDHSIVFLGQYGTTQSLLIGEIQSLWAVAYLMDQLPLPNRNEMEEDVALVLAWRRRRYLADGRTFLYDQIPYQSLLLRDLGLNDKRKNAGWKELLQPYRPEDYRGILDEWRAARLNGDPA